MKYLFGDTDLAARRLELLAQVYRQSTETFIERAAGLPSESARKTTRRHEGSGQMRRPERYTRPEIAIDLGCGPGHTTRLLSETYGALHTVGLDNSAAFVAQANATATPNLTFYRHNVCHAPLPAAPADLIFARYLLAHLEESESLARGWVAGLKPGGKLLLEEVERIDTDVDAFTEYLAIVERMLICSGSDLYIGDRLPGFCPEGAAAVTHNELCRIPVSNRDAATMFSMNIATWGTNAFIRANYGRGEILALESELLRIAEGGDARGVIVWSQRQVAFEKR